MKACEENIKCGRQFFNSGMTVKEVFNAGLLWFDACKHCSENHEMKRGDEKMDPLRHESKLDVAEEILAFIAGNSDAEEIRKILRDRLELSDSDFDHAHEVVHQIRYLIEDQKY